MTSVEPQVFALAQAGDPQAIEQLLRQLQPDIRRYARWQCHRSSAIEDVVQEAMIIVYRRVGTVREPRALAGWVARVVGRLCLLPALAWMRLVEEIDGSEDARRIATLPQDELRHDLARALESLPAMYREVILLRDMEQLTISETAQRLAVTPEAVKSRLHRARALVREYLGAG